MPQTTDLEQVQVALGILTGKNTEPSLADLNTLGYDIYTLRKVPSMQELKDRSEEVICKIVAKEN